MIRIIMWRMESLRNGPVKRYLTQEVDCPAIQYALETGFTIEGYEVLPKKQESQEARNIPSAKKE